MNNVKSKRVLLVELLAPHDYFLYSQIQFLIESGYSVDVLLTTRLRSKESAEHFKQMGANVFVLEQRNNVRELHGKVLFFFTLMKWFIIHSNRRYTQVVFNTPLWYINGNCRWYIILFKLLIPYKPSALIHNSDILVGPVVSRKQTTFTQLLSQWLFHRDGTLYVLERQLYDKITHRITDDTHRKKVSYVHLTYLPEEIIRLDHDSWNGANKVRFVIPGNIDIQRDYQGLIDCFSSLSEHVICEQIEILILGSVNNELGEKLVREAEKHDLLGSCLVIVEESHAYMPFETYMQHMYRHHFLLTLVNQKIIRKKRYGSGRVISVVYHSQFLKIPLVVTDVYSLEADLTPFAIRHPDADYITGIESAVALYYTPEYMKMRQAYKAMLDARYEEDKARYIAGIERRY